MRRPGRTSRLTCSSRGLSAAEHHADRRGRRCEGRGDPRVELYGLEDPPRHVVMVPRCVSTGPPLPPLSGRRRPRWHLRPGSNPTRSLGRSGRTSRVRRGRRGRVDGRPTDRAFSAAPGLASGKIAVVEVLVDEVPGRRVPVRPAPVMRHSPVGEAGDPRGRVRLERGLLGRVQQVCSEHA